VQCLLLLLLLLCWGGVSWRILWVHWLRACAQSQQRRSRNVSSNLDHLQLDPAQHAVLAKGCAEVRFGMLPFYHPLSYITLVHAVVLCIKLYIWLHIWSAMFCAGLDVNACWQRFTCMRIICVCMRLWCCKRAGLVEELRR
jgi:hypothetical protein